jgi:hypothetical protein
VPARLPAGQPALPQEGSRAAAQKPIMREENSDWLGVMRFYDMELIT